MVNVVSHTESMRPLHSGRYAIGPDLRLVEANVERPMLQVDVAPLVSCHGLRLARMRPECNDSIGEDR
jgi:hypothetical protein